MGEVRATILPEKLQLIPLDISMERKAVETAS